MSTTIFYPSPPSTSHKKVFKKQKQNPGADTSFLPDASRAEWEKCQISTLESLWESRQEILKSQKLALHLVFWDGANVEKVVRGCTRGSTVGEFLDVCKREWTELRGLSLDSLMFVSGISKLGSDIQAIQ